MSAPLVQHRDGLLIFPGLIDCHVHFREPGLTHKATMETEAASAFAGGVTTVCEMPNTIPPAVTVEAFAGKVRIASAITIVDIRFFFGVTQMEHLAELKKLFSSDIPVPAAGVRGPRLRDWCSGVKVYLDHSTGNQKAEESVVEELFQACAELGITLVAHCEDPATNAAAAAAVTRTDVAAHSLKRPPEAEAIAIRYAIGLAHRHGTHLHVAHLSTKEGIALVREAKKEGLPVTCEVAPHHLFLTVEDYETLGTRVKMNPPIRTMDHRDALWEGIKDGTVDCISTDHAPHTIEEKNTEPPLSAPSGVPGVETMLPLLLSVALDHWPHPMSARPAAATLTPEDIARVCFENPNRIFNLKKNPDEQTVVIDPGAEWVIRGAELHSKCGWTPFEGWTVRGKIVR